MHPWVMPFDICITQGSGKKVFLLINSMSIEIIFEFEIFEINDLISFYSVKRAILVISF